MADQHDAKYKSGLFSQILRQREDRALQKSFAETPAGCTNMLIAGVVTDEMQTRLDQMGVTKVFYLDDIASEGAKWDAFVHELFHHTIRIA